MKICSSHGVLFSKTCQGLITKAYRNQTGLIFSLPIPPPKKKGYKIRNLKSPNKFVSGISLARKIRQQLIDGQYVDATSSWSELEGVISRSSNSVV